MNGITIWKKWTHGQWGAVEFALGYVFFIYLETLRKKRVRTRVTDIFALLFASPAFLIVNCQLD